ncbi:MAG: N-acetylmuramoyl-L-alanine amidase [Oscillospiraceae bacterium]|nr:N-acetylmuramoyl-L-alanine amidase [Oscillospiraceae bacterium]
MFDKMNWWFPLALIVLLAVAVLVKPSEIAAAAATAPTPVLVIDAGHGGADGGAVATDGTLESDLNLDIALRLEALAAFWGVDTVMTRDSAEIDYPAEADTLAAMKRADQYARAALVNSTAGAVLISIHQNNYPAAAPWGIQVFYGGVAGSDTLAAVLQENLTGQLCSNTRRLAEPIDSSIYLMKKASCTAVLVECGFLSNPEDLSKLRTEEYRLELATVILASYLQYIQGITT